MTPPPQSSPARHSHGRQVQRPLHRQVNNEHRTHIHRFLCPPLLHRTLGATCQLVETVRGVVVNVGYVSVLHDVIFIVQQLTVLAEVGGQVKLNEGTGQVCGPWLEQRQQPTVHRTERKLMKIGQQVETVGQKGW